MELKEFLQQTIKAKNSILIILACSSSKRSDQECKQLFESLSLQTQRKILMHGYTEISEFVKSFRACSQFYHPLAVIKDSKWYPAFLRYSGYFYKSVEEFDITLWQKIEKENWNILIVSAYYGFIHVQESIQYYNLQISKLNPKCRKILPDILNGYLNTNPHISKVLFLTSKEYTKPFIGNLQIDAFRIRLLNGTGNEIVGPYGKDFYQLTGKLFSSLISGKFITFNGVKEVCLEKL